MDVENCEPDVIVIVVVGLAALDVEDGVYITTVSWVVPLKVAVDTTDPEVIVVVIVGFADRDVGVKMITVS